MLRPAISGAPHGIQREVQTSSRGAVGRGAVGRTELRGSPLLIVINRFWSSNPFGHIILLGFHIFGLSNPFGSSKSAKVGWGNE